MDQGLIRVFHDDSFIDDPTRIIRALRFMAKFGFIIEEHTKELMIKATKHEDWQKWQKKRKSRFEIERNYILELNQEQKDRVTKFIDENKILEEFFQLS